MDFNQLKKNLKKVVNVEEMENIPESESTINVSALNLSPTQKIVISISHFKDKLFLDLRHWYRQEAGNWIPTKKGVHLPLEMTSKIAEVVALIQKEL